MSITIAHRTGKTPNILDRSNYQSISKKFDQFIMALDCRAKDSKSESFRRWYTYGGGGKSTIYRKISYIYRPYNLEKIFVAVAIVSFVFCFEMPGRYSVNK